MKVTGSKARILHRGKTVQLFATVFKVKALELSKLKCLLCLSQGLETSPMGSRVLTVNKALTGSQVHMDSRLKGDLASLGDHLELRQEVMEGVLKVKSACFKYTFFVQSCALQVCI